MAAEPNPRDLGTSRGRKVKSRLLSAGLLAAATYGVLTWILNSMLFHPSREVVAGAGQEVTYRAADGTRLVGYWVGPGNPESVVVYFHGNAGTASGLRDWAATRVNATRAYFLAEYRGYGASEGSPSAAGIREDGDAAIRYVRETRRLSARAIAVWGHSLGGSVAAQVVAHHVVRAAIFESTFSSLHDMARRVVGFPATYLVPAGYELDSVSALSRVTIPTLHLHGDRDETIPFALGRRLFERCASRNKRWVAIAGGMHSIEDHASRATIEEFLEAVFGRFDRTNGV